MSVSKRGAGGEGRGDGIVEGNWRGGEGGGGRGERGGKRGDGCHEKDIFVVSIIPSLH